MNLKPPGAGYLLWPIAAALIGALGAGCARPRQSAYPPTTTLSLSSERCAGDAKGTPHRCRCRPLDSNDDQTEGALRSGYKRFELRLPQTASALWVGIGDRGFIHKEAREVDASCYYVDLPPGDHDFVMHAKRSEDAHLGLQTGLTIYEYGDRVGPSWYRSLHFTCGVGASRCTQDELDAWLAFQRRLPRGVLDPCGSVMARRVRVSGSRAQRGDDQYSALTLHFVLRVYRFEPHHAPGSAQCRTPGTRGQPSGDSASEREP